MDALLVFLKYPTPGAVKTRMGAQVGYEQAANIYREWIGLVLSEMQPIRGRRQIVACYDGAPLESFSPWRLLADDWWPQAPGELGNRLQAAFNRAHTFTERVAAIGTDCLDLDAMMVLRAFARLKDHDVVFGPAFDGGYYLVGASKPLPGFFDDLPWSTVQLFHAHLDRCHQNGWTADILPALPDIDTWDEWLCYCLTRGFRSSSAWSLQYRDQHA